MNRPPRPRARRSRYATDARPASPPITHTDPTPDAPGAPAAVVWSAVLVNRVILGAPSFSPADIPVASHPAGQPVGDLSRRAHARAHRWRDAELADWPRDVPVPFEAVSYLAVRCQARVIGRLRSRGFASTADDAFGAAVVALVESGARDTLAHPKCVAAWLFTTARRIAESWAEDRELEELSDDPGRAESPATIPDADDDERIDALDAFHDTLRDDERALLARSGRRERAHPLTPAQRQRLRRLRQRFFDFVVRRRTG